MRREETISSTTRAIVALPQGDLDYRRSVLFRQIPNRTKRKIRVLSFFYFQLKFWFELEQVFWLRHSHAIEKFHLAFRWTCCSFLSLSLSPSKPAISRSPIEVIFFALGQLFVAFGRKREICRAVYVKAATKCACPTWSCSVFCILNLMPIDTTWMGLIIRLNYSTSELDSPQLSSMNPIWPQNLRLLLWPSLCLLVEHVNGWRLIREKQVLPE